MFPVSKIQAALTVNKCCRLVSSRLHYQLYTSMWSGCWPVESVDSETSLTQFTQHSLIVADVAVVVVVVFDLPRSENKKKTLWIKKWKTIRPTEEMKFCFFLWLAKVSPACKPLRHQWYINTTIWETINPVFSSTQTVKCFLSWAFSHQTVCRFRTGAAGRTVLVTAVAGFGTFTPPGALLSTH